MMYNCKIEKKRETNSLKPKIRITYDNDIDSKLGTYLQVNPDLETPSYDDNTFESGICQ